MIVVKSKTRAKIRDTNVYLPNPNPIFIVHLNTTFKVKIYDVGQPWQPHVSLVPPNSHAFVTCAKILWRPHLEIWFPLHPMFFYHFLSILNSFSVNFYNKWIWNFNLKYKSNWFLIKWGFILNSDVLEQIKVGLC